MRGVSVVAVAFTLLVLRPFAAATLACAAERALTPPVTDARKAEAAERFDRGMALLEEGDNAGALAELTRVYALAPHPQVLFNLGLIHASMGRPVEAMRALDQVLAAPGTLPAGSVRLARRTRDDQARRVALLEVTTNVPAIVEADGIEIGKTPFAQPVPVAAGTRIVSAVSPGYLTMRKEITVAGQTTEKLQLELAPSDLRMAHLSIRSALPDADILVDGQRMGRTPLPTSLAVPPGRRIVELRRVGYRPAQREILLDDGAAGELSIELLEDEGDPVKRGRLVLVVSETDPDVAIDGQPRGAYRGPQSLPPGRHQVRAARAGFLQADRSVTIGEGADTTVRITLTPTPETRATYKDSVHARRTWGWAATVGGAAVTAAAGIVVAVNRGPLRDARAEVARLAPMFEIGGHCDINDDFFHRDECKKALEAADANFNQHQTLQNIGLIGIGVGVVAAGVGAALLMTADDPDRYDSVPRDSDSPGKPALFGWLLPGAGGLALTGRF